MTKMALTSDHNIPYMGGLCIIQGWTGRIKVSATRWLMLSPELFRGRLTLKGSGLDEQDNL